MAIAADCKSAPSGFGGSSPPPPTKNAAEFLCKPSGMSNLFAFPRRSQETRLFFGEKKAEVAQLVEHQPSKLRVASSNLVFRSRHKKAGVAQG